MTAEEGRGASRRFDVAHYGWLYETDARDLAKRILRSSCEPLLVVVQSRITSGRWGSRKLVLADELWPDLAGQARCERNAAVIMLSIPPFIRTEVEYHMKSGGLLSALHRSKELTAALEKLVAVVTPTELGAREGEPTK